MTSERKWAGPSRLVAVMAAAGALATPTGALAQDTPPTDVGQLVVDTGEPGHSEIAPINAGNWTFSMGAEVVSEYWFRGISQGPANTRGFIPQLYADASVLLFEGDEFSLALNVGTWNSFTSSNAGGGAGSGAWYEADIFAGVSVGLPMDLSMDVSYVLLYGPAAGAEFAQEIDLAFAWDDSTVTQENMGLPFSLQPYVLFAFEVSGGSDGVGDGTGGYFEFGIEPSIVVLESEDYPVTLSVPLTVGLNLYNYYSPVDDTFGYFDGGIVFSVPLSFIPTEFGVWEASAGVHFLYLGANGKTISRLAGTGGDSVQIIGVGGISMSY